MTVMSDSAEVTLVPETTVSERCGSQRSISRFQLSLSDAGQMTTAG